MSLSADRSFDAAIIGSGFGGSILARCLAARGRRVLLVDEAQHPRFALGESSTPLAALSLDRLAERYGLTDLPALGAWGRLRAELPGLGCGLKRGFTFYRHRPGAPFSPEAGNPNRLLVAASARDGVADVHWLRSDVDAHLVKRAIASDVVVFGGRQLTGLERTGDGFRLTAADGEAWDAGRLVDATGGAGVLTARTGDGPSLETRSGLVFAHLRGVRHLEETLDRPLPGAIPYPDHRAAVHHVLDEGWAYELPFDDGLVSFGFLLRDGLEGDTPANDRWQALLARYPTLRAMLSDAVFVEGPRAVARLQYRRRRAAGDGWAALPHACAFVDPLYSTGIAWTLRCVERLADLLTGNEELGADATSRYAGLLGRETERIDGLLAGAYRAMERFDLFAAWSLLYFVEVSFAEARERLRPGADDCWRGFLGADEKDRHALLREARERLEAALAGEDAERFGSWLASRCAPRNIAGLFDPARENLYPVDLATLVAGADHLEMTDGEVRAALHRLREAGRL